jgi:uncharacterized RDD family membrane protein YckC
MSQSEAPLKSKLCSECGEEINKETEVCPECGASQPDISEDENSLNYASLGERFAGTVGDGIFLAITLFPTILFPQRMASGYLFLWIIFALFYQYILEGIWTNQTVGKYVMNMRVAKDDGSEAGIADSVVRNIIGAIGQVFGYLGLLVGAFAIYQSDENKRLGDSIAGTIVMKTQSEE